MYTDETVENAWTRARARCECTRKGHRHVQGCGAPLVWTLQGKATTLGGWEALRQGDLKLGGWEAVNQCEILCWACYRAVTAAAVQQPAHVA